MLLACPGLPHPREDRLPYVIKAFAEGLLLLKDLVERKMSISHTTVSPGHSSAWLILTHSKQFGQIFQTILAYEVDQEWPSLHEKGYFSCVDDERFALSQYLTIIAEMNKFCCG